MENDNPNINKASHDQQEWWDSYKNEQQAKLDKMDAEKRLEANDGFENLQKEVEAAADWTEAQWDEFKAKAQKWSNELEIDTDEAI